MAARKQVQSEYQLKPGEVRDEKGFIIPEPVVADTAVVGNDPAKVYARNANGQLVTVSREEFADDPRLTPVSGQDAAGAEARRRVVDEFASNPLIGYGAGPIGALRGASGGLLDIAMTEGAEFMGRPDVAWAYRNAMPILEETRPLLHGAGHVAGTVAPYLMGLGGASRLASPLTALEGAGKLAGKGTAAIVGGEGIASAAVGLGVEGAALGALEAKRRAAMLDTELTADRFWASSGAGLMFGGILGGGLGAAGRAARGAGSVARKIVDRGMTRRVGTNADQAMGQVQSMYGEGASLGHRSVVEGHLPAIAQGKGRPETYERMFGNEKYRAMLPPEAQKQVFEDASRALKSSGDEMHLSLEAYQDGMTKLQNLIRRHERALDGSTHSSPDVVYGAVENRLAEFEGTIRRIESAQNEGFFFPTGGLGAKKAEQLGDYIGIVREDLAALRGQAARGEITSREFAARTAAQVNELKVQLQSLYKRNKQNANNPLVELLGREGKPEMEGTVSSLLRDEALWGKKAASLNKEADTLVHRMIERMDTTELRALQHVTGSVPERAGLATYGHEFRFSVENINNNLLGRLDDFTKDHTVGLLKEQATDAARLNELLTKEFGLATKGNSEQALKMLDHLDHTKAMSVADKVGYINQAKTLIKGDPQTWTRILGFSFGGLVGGKTGAVIGGILGSKLATILDPGNSMRQLAQLESIYGTGNDFIPWFARKMFGGRTAAESAAGSVGRGGMVHETAEILKKAAKPLTNSVKAVSRYANGRPMKGLIYEAFREVGDDDTKAYERHLEHLRTAVENPQVIEEGVREFLGPDLANMAPNVHQGLVNKTLTASQILLSHAPPADRSGVQFDWYRMGPSDREIEEWEDLYEAVMDPYGALLEAVDGMLSPKTIEVLDQVIPEQMNQIRAALQAELVEMDDPPEYSKRVQLSFLLKMPLDPSMTPGYVAAMQEGFAAEQGADQEQAGNQYRNRRTYGNDGERRDYNTSVDRLEAGIRGQ